MRVRKKIILDRVLGRPFAFLLNLVVWPLGRVAFVEHDDSPSKVKTIVLAKMLGMGSILRATPLLRGLKKKYPEAKVIFITTRKNKPLIENIPLIEEAFYVRDSSVKTLFVDTVFLISKLWKRKVDLYFDLEVYSALSTILAVLSLARNRYGFYKTSTQFRLGLNTHLVYFNDTKHISQAYLQLAAACGIKEQDYQIESMSLAKEGERELREFLRSKKLDFAGKYIVINPNASDLLLERRWPLEYFVCLINALSMNWKGAVFVVGSLDEFPYVQELCEKLEKKAKAITLNLCGEVSLKAVMSLIAKAGLMVTNDSGLYHIAESFNTPVISLWGPVDPRHYAGEGSASNFIFYSKDTYCSPCVHRTDLPPCRGNNICMKSIHPKDVYKKACEALGILPMADPGGMEKAYKSEDIKNFDIIIRNRKRTK